MQKAETKPVRRIEFKGRMQMAELKSGWSHFVMAATCLLLALTVGAALWPQSSGLTITLAGQSMIRSDVRLTAPSAVPVMSSLLRGDVKFTNFEGVVAEPGQPSDSVPETRPNGGWLDPPGTLGSLQALGFNLVSLSNNHAWDLKAVGIQNTLREANRLNLVHAGIGNTMEEAVAPGYLHTPKGTVALIAMASGEVAPGGAATAARPGVDELRVHQGSEGHVMGTTSDQYGVPLDRNDEDAQRILQSIRNAKNQADLVIMYQHNHVFEKPFGAIFSEELPERLVPPAWIKKWTHEEIDAGADIVVMHGAPLVHGVEIYRGKPIFYDLGNFIFNMVPTGGLDEPIIFESVVTYLQYQGKNLQSISFVPIVLNKIGEGQPEVHNGHANNQFLDTRGLPKPATGDQARYILERLAESSKPFGTAVAVKGDTAEIDLTGKH
jgi:poly-gamma-glutamate capsule biosynthesis protein CapA/YwtB (metallophosphatase superfamily)